MTTYHTIVVADGSEVSESAVENAAEIALANSAQLVLVCAYGGGQRDILAPRRPIQHDAIGARVVRAMPHRAQTWSFPVVPNA